MRIIILSRNSSLYSTQSLIRAAFRRGHQVRVVDHVQCDMIIDRGQTIVEINGGLFDIADPIIPRIGSSVTSIGVDLIKHFEMAGHYSLVSSEALSKARDKFRTLQILNAHGIDVPKTIVVNTQNFDSEIIKSEFDFPVIIKLFESTHGAGVIKGDSPQNVISTIGALHSLKQRILIQEFIKESEGRDIRAFVVGNKIIASMMRIAEPGNFRSNLHQGGRAERILLKPKEVNMALKATQLLGLKVAGVDILRTPKKSYVIEVNASPGLEGIEKTTKVDIAGKIISFMEEEIRNNRR